MVPFAKTIGSLERGLESGLHLGAQIAVIRDGEVVLNHAVGENAPDQPLTTDHLMPWLSTCKPITAVAVLQLVEKGVLGLDDRVSDHISDFGQGGKVDVTIRHLLTHTGGFREGDRISEHLTWDETIDRVCAVPLEPDWVPGARAGYHIRGSWFILGELVRRATGRELDRYVREKILVPLGIEKSWMALPGDVLDGERDRVGLLHFSHDIEPVLHPFLNRDRYWMRACPGSSLRGPVVELARFYDHLRRILDDGTDGVLSRDSVKAMVSRQRDGMFDLTFQHIMDWGFGVIINSARHGRGTVPYGFGLHASDNTFGHGGMQSSSAFSDPEHRISVAWVCNGMPGEGKHQLRAREINALIYEDLGLGG